MKLKNAKLFLSLILSSLVSGCQTEQAKIEIEELPPTESIDDNGPEFVRVDNRRLFYTEQGTGPAVLILHGADGYIENQFDSQMTFLSENGFRAIYLERAGRGRSDARRDRLTISRDADDVIKFMNALKIEEYYLLGHSAGSVIARRVAQTRPEAILGIISIDSGSFAKLDRNALQALPIDRYDLEDQEAYTRNIQTLIDLNRPFDYPSDFNTALMQSLKEKNSQINQRRWKYGPDSAHDPKTDLCGIPTLALVAGRGKVLPHDPEAILLEQNTPCAQVVIVTKSGHYIHMEQPEFTNQAILNFVRDNGAGDE